MISTPLIAVATALVLGAIIARIFARGPQKAEKTQKAEILKQLLAISERETRVSATPSSARLRAPSPVQGRLPGNAQRKTTTKISRPIRSKK